MAVDGKDGYLYRHSRGKREEVKESVSSRFSLVGVENERANARRDGRTYRGGPYIRRERRQGKSVFSV